MTLLRRTAQLVEDLRTLNVLNKKDDVKFLVYSDKSIELIIYWDTYKDSIRDTVKYFITDEFGKNNIKVVTDVYSFFSCNILLQ